MSPLSRTLRWCEENGYTKQKVEHYNFFSKRRIDLFGFADIVAIKSSEVGCLALQVTSNDHVADHITKVSSGAIFNNLKVWLEAKNRFEIHGWGKKGKRGERKTWQLRVVPLTLETLKPLP